VWVVTPTNNREAKGAAQLVVFIVIVVVLGQEGEADQEGPIRGGPQRAHPRTERGTTTTLACCPIPQTMRAFSSFIRLIHSPCANPATQAHVYEEEDDIYDIMLNQVPKLRLLHY